MIFAAMHPAGRLGALAAPDEGAGAGGGGGVVLGGASNASAGQGGAGGTTAAAFDWSGAGLDKGGLDLVSAKGWKGVGDAVKGYGELERLVGLDKIALPGKDAKPEDWNAVYDKLGRPAAPDKYVVPKLEQGEYGDADKAFHAAILPVLHQAGLTQRQLDTIVPALNAHGAQAQQRMAQARDARAAALLAETSGALTQEFGGADKFAAAIEDANGMLRQMLGKDGLEVWNGLRFEDGSYLGAHPAIVRGVAKFAAALKADGMLVGGNDGAGGGAGGAGGPQAEYRKIIDAAKADPKHAYNDPKNPEHQAMRDRVWRLINQSVDGAS